MNPRFHLRTALLVAQAPLVCSLLCGVAQAQPAAPTPAETSNASTAPGPTAETAAAVPTTPPQQRGPVHVSVALVGYDVAPEEVSNAITRDLGLSLTPDASLAQCRFVVDVERGKNLSLTFYGSNGLELKRVVRAPEANTDVSEVAALLAVNLARDEAPQLLPLLGAEPSAPPVAVEKKQPTIAPAATPSSTPTAPAPLALPSVPVNASFVYPLTIVRNVTQRAVGFELGLIYSDVGAIDGAGISGVVMRSRQRSDGVLIAGAVGIVGTGSADGTATQTAVSGVQVSGAVGITNGNLDGAQISGALSFASDNVEGAQIAGAANVAGGNVEGVQIGGAASIADDFKGLQLSGALSSANGNVSGAQIAGAVNIAKDVDGAQISSVNIGKQVSGAQIGLVNIGHHVKGAQIGLVNIADEVDGASVGIVTYSKKGQTQITSWYDSTRPFNLGVRFVSGPLYALPSVGADPRNTEAFDFGFSLGARIPVQRLYVDVDGNTRMSFESGKVREHEIDLRYRLTVGFQVLPWLGVFAGGGVHHYFNVEDSGTQHFKPFWAAGIDLL